MFLKLLYDFIKLHVFFQFAGLKTTGKSLVFLIFSVCVGWFLSPSACPLVWVLGDRPCRVSPGPSHSRRAWLLQSPILPFEVTVVGRSSCPEAHSWVPKYRPGVVLRVAKLQSLLLVFSKMYMVGPHLRAPHWAFLGRRWATRGESPAGGWNQQLLTQGIHAENLLVQNKTYQVSKERKPIETVKQNQHKRCLEG